MSDSPLSKFQRHGAGTLTSAELLAIALSHAEDDSEAAKPAAVELLKKLGGIRSVAAIPPAAFRDAGLDDLGTAKCLALIELGRRTTEAGRGERKAISLPIDVVGLFNDLREERKEHFYAVLLDAKGRVMKRAEVHVGTLSLSIVGVREFFQEAIREGAASVIAVHNHPSGDPTPSKEDFEVTRILVDAGKLLEIPLLDHIIIGECEHRSLKELGAIS